jgi:hypothetical protein
MAKKKKGDKKKDAKKKNEGGADDSKKGDDDASGPNDAKRDLIREAVRIKGELLREEREFNDFQQQRVSISWP